MDVKRLSVGVRRLLSASARVNNYKTAVEELVYNSLDAESTSIAIRIHIQNNWIQVVDNGIGIKKADYNLLGDRYATSKLIDINTLKAVPSKNGYQGQALANIIEVSQAVRITSRCGDSNGTWVKTFYEGKIERECFKAPTRPSKGTTVEINGFLYNLNIQKKHINAFNEVQDIKMLLEQLSLVFNKVSISLRDDAENEIVFKIHKNRDIYQTLKSMFDIVANDVQEFQVEKNEYKVKAFIGVDKKSTKNCHWIYLNNKFIEISNLHKVINNKFTKLSSMKNSKIKTKGYVYKENVVVCEFVPFYFLFISCPYYEYDIINSGKQITVEFKNWLQINKLIEKLVKFYSGDINLINVQKNENQKQGLEDTKDEVKKIMEKILGNPHKIGKISQMQNGIKGKRIRRKKKKQQVSLTKILPPRMDPHENLENHNNILLSKNKVAKVTRSKYSDKNIHQNPEQKVSLTKRLIPRMDPHENLENHNNIVLCKNKVAKVTRSEYSDKNIHQKPAKNCFKPYNKGNKMQYNKLKERIKCKCNKRYNNIIELFKNDANSIKRRCGELSCNIKDLLNMKNYEVVKDLSITKNRSSVINTKSPDTVEFKDFSYKKTMIQQIRSYDLLQTVLNTQQRFYNQESKREDEFAAICDSNAEQRTYTKSYNCAPKLTFESHRYNINNTLFKKKISEKGHFIGKQTKEYFNIGTEKQKPHAQIKTSKNTKRQGLHNARHNMRLDINKCDRLLNKYYRDGFENAFSIDLSNNDIVEISKQIRNQVMNDMNSLFDNANCDKISDTKSQLNLGVNLNIEKTYTIVVDSFYNSLQTQHINVHKDRKTITDETITQKNENYHDVNNGDHACMISTDIFTSRTHDPLKLSFDEPLDICEAILSSPKELDDDIRFNVFSRYDSSLIMNEPKDTNDILKGENNHEVKIYKTSPQKQLALVVPQKENDRSLKAFNELPDQMKRRNEDFDPNKIDTDFKLNARHRFVPKGMSQIFEKCFSKNLCSYNLDTEYYDNAIYDNFVEDVAVNSEIFEQKVQNIKEFTTNDIHKVTEKVKKQNADLIFGSNSLRTIKVLGQVDCKFIAAIIRGVSHTHKSSEFLVLFDQHAVHERVRLEKILSDYFNDNNWKTVTIDTVSVKSSKEEILYLHNHKDKFSRFGLDWSILNNSEIIVNGIPEAIRGKNPRPMEIIIKTVKDLISEQMHAIKYLKGNVSLYPQSIMNLVFNEACRYAIKFGDHLTKKDCIDLLAALADCKTPFQCAHGRPVMAVMVELKKEQFEYKFDVDKIMKFNNMKP